MTINGDESVIWITCHVIFIKIHKRNNMYDNLYLLWGCIDIYVCIFMYLIKSHDVTIK